MKRYSDVFKPNTYPELTYVSRVSDNMKYTYEQRLKQSLSIDGSLTYIVGPSKTGKTVLCENVIGYDNMIPMSGNDFRQAAGFWEAVGKKIGLPMNAAISDKNLARSEWEERETVVTKNYLSNKDKIVHFFIEHKKVLVLDDFHYASESVQYDIACQLKEVIRLGFKAVIISLPYRSDDAIRENPDLMGRIQVIEIQPWQQTELRCIAEKGFQELSIDVAEELIRRMAMESINSPQLMQSICLNIGLLPGDGKMITDAVIEDSCMFTCSNFPYGDVVRVLKAGPPTRGQKRLKYDLKDGTQRDIYSLFLKALADNPPSTSVDLEGVVKRIQDNVTESRITTKKIRDMLNNLQKIISELGPLYHVFEWKDDILHIVDPLFLFYIRWTPI